MQRPILTILVILLLLALGIVILWLPQYRDFNDLRLEIKGKKAALETKEQYFSNLERTARRLQEYSSEVSKIDSMLPLSPAVSGLLNFLTKISSENGLLLQRFEAENISPLEAGSDIFKIPLTISVVGPYPAFKNFLAKIQASSRLLEVERVSFSAPATGVIFSFDLKIRTHSY